MIEKTCCFIGHRDVAETERLKYLLRCKIEDLIVRFGVKVFLFGSASSFDNLCYKVVTNLKALYPEIRREYVRAEYEFVDENYEKYLLEFCEVSYFPQSVSGAGSLSYIKRNRFMIDNSDYCIFYYNENYLPRTRKKSKYGLCYQPRSGTALAYNYATKKKKIIINMY